MNVISPETRMMALPYGEEIVIVGRTRWTQSMSVTDRQTDGRTDRQTDRERDRRTDRRTELLPQRPCNAERRTVKNCAKFFGHPVIMGLDYKLQILSV